jgi:cytochrome c-type biogenesis protein CcmH/NrfG
VRQTNSLPPFSWLGASKRASSGVVRRVGVLLFVLLATVLLAAALDAGQVPPKPQLSAAHKAWLDEEAVGTLERAVERYGINAVLMNLMGECLAELGRIPDALAAFEKSLALSPDQPSVRARIDELKKRK